VPNQQVFVFPGDFTEKVTFSVSRDLNSRNGIGIFFLVLNDGLLIRRLFAGDEAFLRCPVLELVDLLRFVVEQAVTVAVPRNEPHEKRWNARVLD
jgi:hypothetical protein